METSASDLAATKQPEGQVENDSDSDDNSCDQVKVDIAIVGNAGSGRSSFVNAILGFEQKDKNAVKPSSGKETSSYFHPTSPNIIFSILPSIGKKTFRIFKEFLDCSYIEKFDAFLIFTDKMFDKRHLAFAKTVRKSSDKPVFFVRTKFDNNNNSQGGEEETILHELRTNFAKKFKEFELNESEMYIISNNEPVKWDFLKLTKAIEAALPSQKGRFSKIPIIQKLIALENFHDFLEAEEMKREEIANYEEIKELFLQSGIAGVQRMMNRKLRQWKEVKIKLAILGNSGAGKSSFVNAIRGVPDDDDDKNSAKTGAIETTREATGYPHPTNPNICFWDLPGIGTPNYPDLETFCELVKIESFDTFLILSSERFTQNDKLLAAKVKSMGKSFFFIRTKIDNDELSEQRKKGYKEEKMRRQISDSCIENIKAFGLSEEDVFLISSHYPDTWDFGRLQKAILDQLPSKQKESLILTLHTKSKDVLREKVELLKRRLWMVSTSSVSKKFGFWPYSEYLIRDRVREIIQSYSLHLEFPTQDSKEFKRLSLDLQKRVKKFNEESYQDILLWLKSFDRDNTRDIKDYKKYIVTKKPLIFLQHSLTVIIDEMAEIALAILDEAAESAFNDDSN